MFPRLAFALLVTFAAACHSAKAPELRVLNLQQAPAQIVYVQVTNPASRPMRLTKLEYRFASSGGSTVSEGSIPLTREVAAGAAVIVEVPLETTPEEAITLRGKLITEQDHIIKSFKVSADIQPAK